jgi:dephospho-CoA kinase
MVSRRMAKPYVIGLTGSIGMGKSQTAALFAAEGIPVYDSDAAIHRLYAKGGAAVEKIAEKFSGAVKNGAVDRAALSALVTDDAQKLAVLEKLAHPLVAADRDRFLAGTGADIVVLDIPLLFETGAQEDVDAVVVASAPAEIQRQRVLTRPGMSEEKFAALKARQLPDAQKRQQAHYVVMTDQGLDQAREQVKMILASVREKLRHA